MDKHGKRFAFVESIRILIIVNFKSNRFKVWRTPNDMQIKENFFFLDIKGPPERNYLLVLVFTLAGPAFIWLYLQKKSKISGVHLHN